MYDERKKLRILHFRFSKTYARLSSTRTRKISSAEMRSMRTSPNFRLRKLSVMSVARRDEGVTRRETYAERETVSESRVSRDERDEVCF